MHKRVLNCFFDGFDPSIKFGAGKLTTSKFDFKRDLQFNFKRNRLFDGFDELTASKLRTGEFHIAFFDVIFVE